MDQQLLSLANKISLEFLSFVNKCASAYHVTHYCKQELIKKGFIELSEAKHWNLQKGLKYFFTKNESTLFAFTIGKNFNSLDTGFKIIGGHTDSPCLKLAPVSACKSQEFLQLCICPYGGGLWHTWFDRDLTLAGKIIYKNENCLESKLYHCKRPILKIPNLAIHLQSAEEREAFKVNKEQHLRPIFATKVLETLQGQEKTHPAIMRLIEKECQIEQGSIVDFDLNIIDTQPAQLIGLNEEFISGPRLDNQMSCFLALKAILDSEDNNSSWINVITLYDHEECGSESAQGADSVILPQTLKRIYDVLVKEQNEVDGFQQAIAKSFQISADMAHSIHPNYGKQIKKGLGIKVNVNQNYATDCVSSAILQQLSEYATQQFIVRNDSPCGSTIGRMVSANTGIKTIDVGNPMLSMHSIRETCGVKDTYECYALFKKFFDEFHNLKHNLFQK